MGRKKKKLTPAMRERQRQQTWFKKHVTWSLKKDPTLSGRDLIKTFRQKGGRIGNEVAKDIVRTKKRVPFDVRKQTGKIKHIDVRKSDKRKYKSPYTYVMGYRLLSDSPDMPPRIITIPKNEKTPLKRLIDEVQDMLESLSAKQRSYYGFIEHGIADIFLINAHRNTGKLIPIIYA